MQRTMVLNKVLLKSFLLFVSLMSFTQKLIAGGVVVGGGLVGSSSTYVCYDASRFNRYIFTDYLSFAQLKIFHGEEIESSFILRENHEPLNINPNCSMETCRVWLNTDESVVFSLRTQSISQYHGEKLWGFYQNRNINLRLLCRPLK